MTTSVPDFKGIRVLHLMIDEYELKCMKLLLKTNDIQKLITIYSDER